MKKIMTIMLIGTGLLAAVTSAPALGAMLAFYTLDQTASDLLGNYDDAQLMNAPYEEGGVYLNGLYIGTDSNGSQVMTDAIDELDFSALSVRIDIKLGELPAGNMPILFCGPSWRWMGASLTSGGHLFMNYNGYTGPAGAETVTVGDWHTIAMVYDGTTGHLILDGLEVASQEFVPNHNNDRRFATYNGSNGTAFKGHVRNLVVYNGVVQFVADAGAEAIPEPALLLGSHPNPFNPRTKISYRMPVEGPIRLSVHDLRGREVALLAEMTQIAGYHEERWDGRGAGGRDLPSGIYLVNLTTPFARTTHKITLAR